MASERSTDGAVAVNGVRLSYRRAGDADGVPVMLLHGSGSSASTWDRLTPHLTAAGHRTIAVDLRGHGGSSRTRDYSLTSLRDDVLALLDAFALPDATLIGHSVGAYAALAAALEAPGRVTRLVLEDLAAPPRRPGASTRINPLQAVAAVAGILTGGRDYDLRAVVALLRRLSRPDPAWWDRLGDLRHAALVVSGGPTSCIPPARLADATSAIPQARLVTIAVGHRVHSLAPDEFATEVLRFLTEPIGAVPRG